MPARRLRALRRAAEPLHIPARGRSPDGAVSRLSARKWDDMASKRRVSALSLPEADLRSGEVGTGPGHVVTAPELNAYAEALSSSEWEAARVGHDVPDYMAYRRMDLTERARRAFDAYASEDIYFRNMNAYLRGMLSPETRRNPAALAQIKQQVHDLLVAFDRYSVPIRQRLIAYRYTFEAGLPKNLRVGNIYRNRGFVSTSLNPTNPGSEIVLRLPSGLKVIGGRQQLQSEVILRHGTRMRYLGRNTQDQWVFDVLPARRQPGRRRRYGGI